GRRARPRGRRVARGRRARRRGGRHRLVTRVGTIVLMLVGADFATLLIPVWIALFLLVVVLLLGLLGRVSGGKYLRPIIATMAKVPILRKGLQKLSTAAMERSNPEL